MTHVPHYDRSAELALEDIVAEGSFGKIYRARYKATAAIVAVKVTTMSDQVRNEIHMLSKCNCPFTVGYFGSFMAGPTEMWVITDYCGGGFVSDLMRHRRRLHHHNGDAASHNTNGASASSNGDASGDSLVNEPIFIMPEECICAICAGIVLALEYIHSVNICHRDIQCSSVLISNAGYVKLTSFGLSAELDDVNNKRKSIVGSPRIMAPEVKRDGLYDIKVDVWSLGISVIEMCEGAPPLSELDPHSAQIAIPSRPPPSLANPERWSSALKDFMETCCRIDPGERPESRTLTSHEFVQKMVTVGRQGSPMFRWDLISRS